MLMMEAKLKETKGEAEIEPYFKQCLKQICTLAPYDAKVAGSVHELANAFWVSIDVSSVAFSGASKCSDKNAFMAIDVAFAEIMERIRTYKDGRKFN